MTHRGATAALTLAGVLVAGCTGGTASIPAAASAAGQTQPGTPAASAQPTVGPEVAASAVELPVGSALGPVVLAYTGLGQVDATATGTCSHPAAGVTRLDLDAGTASITVTLDSSGARVDLEDTGLEQHDVLAAGAYTVSGARLVVDAPLTGDAGHLTMDLTCG